MPLFRHLGFRTAREIDEERCALKALRGDFDNVPTAPLPGEDRAAVERALHAAAR